MNHFWRVDFHCHTHASHDSRSRIDILFNRASKQGIDKIVITDHNQIHSAREAFGLYPELFIVGEEILTTKGELLGVFVKEEIPAGLEPFRAIKLLREQDAFISVPHPFDLKRHGWKLQDLFEILPFIDAIEVYNSRCLKAEDNKKAQAFAAKHKLLGTAGSDSHLIWELGRAVTVLPSFGNAHELRMALRTARVEGRLSPFWVHIGSTLARIK